MPIFVDHAGMNMLVSSSFDDTNTLTSARNVTAIGSISVDHELAGINTHRNGPYGYSSWKQLRVSDNPITRHHRETNMMSFVIQPGPIRNVLANGDLRVRDRYSALYRYTEPAVTQKAYPLVWNVGRHFKDEDGNVDMENPQRFSIISSYGNQQIAFANERVSKLHKFDPNEEDTEYVAIKDMYLENGLNKQDSPLTHWEFLQYRETVFPKPPQQYISQTRTRPNFTSFYRHDRTDRTKLLTSNHFGFQPYSSSTVASLSQSQWPLDAAEDFLTRTYSNVEDAVLFGDQTPLGRRGQGILQNNYVDLGWWGTSGSVGVPGTDPRVPFASASILKGHHGIGPLYIKRGTNRFLKYLQNPTGLLNDRFDPDGNLQPTDQEYFTGEALWEAGSKRQVLNDDGTYTSSPKEPFYDTYENYVEEVRKYGKNYSIIPEFRMSTQIEDYERTNGEIELDMFEVTGGISGSENSSKSNFYEIYSNADFMRNFEIIADDHKDFTNGKVLSLRCKAIKKFLPYEGFYPCQRTVDLAERFYDSYGDYIKVNLTGNVVTSSYDFVKQYVLEPLFAPGVLFNTIKSGVAVDYPVITGSLTGGSSMIENDNFDVRIPFEALLEPEKFMTAIPFSNQEASLRRFTGLSAVLSEGGDNLYSKMASNFLAETANFFLPNGQFSSISSKKQKDIKILEKDKVYGMRIKMNRSMSGSRPTAYHSGSEDSPYYTPQDLAFTGSDAVRETFTMYDKPNSFGPLSRGTTIYTASSPAPFSIEPEKYVVSSATSITKESIYGYNFPFTPPYYHGEAWCDIWITGSGEELTIKQIQERVTASFTRFDDSFYTSSGAELSTPVSGYSIGPQAFPFLNSNAVQLSSSLNIFGVGTIRKRGSGGAGGSLVVDSGLAEDSRWVIQTKFETPMLNFNHITGSDHITMPSYGQPYTPIGMWHQYGRIPKKEEGVFLRVGSIPKPYQKIVGIGGTKRSEDFMEDLSAHLGFSGEATKLGRLAQRKEISEAVVAVPFIEQEGRKKFFTLDKPKIDTYKLGLTTENEDAYRKLTNGAPSEQIGRSVLNQIEKMKKYIFPPSFDFINFDTDKVTPVAMYIFEFSHTLTQTDLQDIWQNLPPTIGSEMEVSEVAITHPLLKKELLGPGGEGGTNTIEMPDKLKWMVFKVKQRASNNYFKKTVLRNSEINTEVDSGNVTQDEFGQTSTIQYNWPYDFFSLVEMVKIDAEVEMGNADFSSYTDNIPNWDPVQAEREKIAEVVGGLEDEPIPEVEIPEEPEPPILSGITMAPVTTTIPSVASMLGRTTLTTTGTMTAVTLNTSESTAEKKARIHAERTRFMRQWKEAWWNSYNNDSGREKKKVERANAAAQAAAAAPINFTANGSVTNQRNNPYNDKNWFYYFIFSDEGVNYDDSLGIIMIEAH